MKIKIVTTSPKSFDGEIQRTRQEAETLGHEFGILDLEDFSFNITDGKISCDWIERDIADVYILRGIMHSQKQISELINYLRKKGAKVFDNNFLEHKYSIDKSTDLIKLTLSGILVPDTFYTRNFEDFPEIGNKIGYPFVLKSGKAGKGQRVYKINSKQELLDMMEKFKLEEKEAKSFLLQEYIPYKYDLRCLVIGGKTFTMRRIPKEGDFRANFSLGGSVELFDLDERGKDLAIRALKAVGMGIGGVDILMDKNDRRYIIEVNHTAGFVGMERATGENIAKIYLDYAISNAR
jgi:RimK family alpha-L-glutamate ligase